MTLTKISTQQQIVVDAFRAGTLQAQITELLTNGSIRHDYTATEDAERMEVYSWPDPLGNRRSQFGFELNTNTRTDRQCLILQYGPHFTEADASGRVRAIGA